VRSERAKGDRKHLHNVIHCDLRLLSAIRGEPEEDSVQAANTELERKGKKERKRKEGRLMLVEGSNKGDRD
jgi:hypothetical protein